MNKTSVCIINVYFGKLPNYFKLWIKSCEYNSTIDFLLVTDQTFSFPLPKNIHLYPYSLHQMQKKATEILGFNAVLNHPYKCCDYRPLYGLLFSDQLKTYDYWGHCDMDMILGDIRFFIDKYELDKYDKFLTLGHLSLYKNIKKINEGFMLNGASYRKQPVTYKYVFSNNKNYLFDELDGIYAIFKENNFRIFTKCIFADIHSKFFRYRLVDNFYYLDSKPFNYKYQIFYWEKGKIKRAYYKHGKIYTEEYIYIHFKRRPNFNVTFNEKISDSFYITHLGFFQKTNSVISKETIKNIAPYSILNEKLKLLHDKIVFCITESKHYIKSFISRFF